MDRRQYKSKPQHLVTDARTGEIKTIVFPSDVSVGTAQIPADLTVHGQATFVSQSSQYASASTVQAYSLVNASGSSFLDHTAFGLRLTLSSSCPIPTTDIASGTILYLTPYTSGRVALYDGTSWVGVNTSEISLTPTTMTPGKNHDIFLYLNGNTPALEVGPAWTNDRKRATALSRQDGVYVKSTDATRRYCGTVRALGTGVIADCRTQRFLWNYYNRVDRPLKIINSLTSWSYSGSTWRSANNDLYNSFEFVTGDDEMVSVRGHSLVSTTSGGANFAVGIGVGIDSVTVNSADVYGVVMPNIAATSFFWCHCDYAGYPGFGYHRFSWLEITGGTTITFYGNDGIPTYLQSGLIGTFKG